MFIRRNATFSCLTLLLCVCLIAYWPLTFGLYSLKNDAILYFLPVRYHISESISNGYFPYWSPYLNMGYPLHIDMQAGVWNPFVQLISLFGTYSIYTLGYETLLYVYLSGVGMFLLLRHLKFQITLSLLIATGYMLSGFISDSAQFLCWISGAAFLPFVFLSFYRVLTEKTWKQSILLGFFTYLFFVTAYPAECILLFYFLLAFGISHLIKEQNKITKKEIFRYLKLSAIALSTFVILSLPALISLKAFLELIDRGQGIEYNVAIQNTLHPALLYSYILPLPIWKTPNVAVTDPLSRNFYIGIIQAALLFSSFFIRFRIPFINFLKWAFFIFLIYSFGKPGLLHPFTYDWLPLMNTFRHPVIAKFLISFISCLLAAYTLQHFISKEDLLPFKRKLFLFILGISVIVLIWSLSVSRFNWQMQLGLLSFQDKIKQLLDSSTFMDMVLFNLVLQAPFLYLLYRYWVRKINIRVLLLISIVNSLLHAMLFQPFTVVQNERMSVFNAKQDSIKVQGFPKPDLTKSPQEASTSYALSSTNKYGPISSYAKEIASSYNIYSPGHLSSHRRFWDQESFRNMVFSYPLLYRADTLLTYVSANHNLATRIAVIENPPTLNPIQPNIPFKATVDNFTPNSWEFTISSKVHGFYCLQQNATPLWKLYIDDKPQEIITTNLTFIGFQLNKGTHKIALRYDAGIITICFWVSWLVTLLILAGIITIYFKPTLHFNRDWQ